jgi:hypothetical protein
MINIVLVSGFDSWRLDLENEVDLIRLRRNRSINMQSDGRSVRFVRQKELSFERLLYLFS